MSTDCWAVETLVRGRWVLNTLSPSVSYCLWWQQDCEYVQGRPARTVQCTYDEMKRAYFGGLKWTHSHRSQDR